MTKEEAHQLLNEAKKGLHSEAEITKALWVTGDITPRIKLKQEEPEELYFPIIEPPRRTVVRNGKKVYAEAL